MLDPPSMSPAEPVASGRRTSRKTCPTVCRPGSVRTRSRGIRLLPTGCRRRRRWRGWQSRTENSSGCSGRARRTVRRVISQGRQSDAPRGTASRRGTAAPVAGAAAGPEPDLRRGPSYCRSHRRSARPSRRGRAPAPVRCRMSRRCRRRRRKAPSGCRTAPIRRQGRAPRRRRRRDRKHHRRMVHCGPVCGVVRRVAGNGRHARCDRVHRLAGFRTCRGDGIVEGRDPGVGCVEAGANRSRSDQRCPAGRVGTDERPTRRALRPGHRRRRGPVRDGHRSEGPLPPHFECVTANSSGMRERWAASMAPPTRRNSLRSRSRPAWPRWPSRRPLSPAKRRTRPATPTARVGSARRRGSSRARENAIP